MAVPQPTFGPNGFITPAEADILVAVKEDVNTAFGGVLNMADETPQGQLSVSMAAAIGNKNDAFVFLSQQFDPAYNSGRYQDAIARIYFIERFGAQPTSVICTCSGLQGVIIPAGSLALGQDGNQYVATESGTIGISGTVDMNFACTTNGPIPCPAGNVNGIFQAINGWDSITNATEGVLGRDTETRQQFEERRFASVAKNSVGSLPAIRGTVLALDGVLDCYVTENVQPTQQTIRGVLLGPKSLYVAAVGGDSNAIARAIWTKKAPGCGYNGNTNVTVYDTNSGYFPPLPAYAVAFQRPPSLSILFKVDIQNNAQVPSDAVAQVQTAIIASFAGTDGSQRVTIGSEIFAAQFYSAVRALGSWAQLKSLKIGSNQAPDAVVTGSIAAAVMTVTAVTSGVIVAGGTVSGAGVLDGTRIISQLTGTPGGIGTYSVTLSQTVTLHPLTMASPTLDTITPTIDVVPAVVAANIQVTFT